MMTMMIKQEDGDGDGSDHLTMMMMPMVILLMMMAKLVIDNGDAERGVGGE